MDIHLNSRSHRIACTKRVDNEWQIPWKTGETRGFVVIRRRNDFLNIFSVIKKEYEASEIRIYNESIEDDNEWQRITLPKGCDW